MHHLRDVLSPEELETITAVLAEAEFEDGARTAGEAIRHTKRNLQAKSEGNEAFRELDQLVIAALSRHPVFASLVLPKRILAPTFAKYEPGMHYGFHVDQPIFGGAQPVRTDVSVTLFLSDPDTYEGGELTIEAPGGARQVKFPAGDAVIYPTTSLHRVEPVTEGLRLVAVTWAQSLVREPECRQILHDLNAVLQRRLEEDAESIEARLLAKSYNNLLRQFAEV